MSNSQETSRQAGAVGILGLQAGEDVKELVNKAAAAGQGLIDVRAAGASDVGAFRVYAGK